MAYVFNSINKALQGDEENQNQGTNIFAAGQGGQDPSQGGEGANPQQQVKTSTEGDIGGGGGGSATTSENMPQDMKKQDSRVMKRNVGKVSTPDFTKRIGEQLSTADQKLQEESNRYIEGAKTQAGTYGVDDQTIDAAIGGDQDATGRVSGALKAGPVDYDDFKPETQYEFNEVSDLSSSQGLQNLLKNEARGRLSAKEIEFDRGVLERSPEFLAIREALKGQQSNLSDKAGKLVEDNTTTAQGLIDKAIQDARLGVETGLTGRRDDLIKANEEEARAINLKREEMRKAGIPKEVQDQILGIRNELAGEFDDSLRMDDLLLNAGIDPAEYLSFAGDVGMRDMVDEQEAMRFNSILQLLGKGGDTWSAGKGAGEDFSLDADRVREAIVTDATNQRGTIDQKLKSERAAIEDAIRARIDEQNQVRAREYERQKNEILARVAAASGMSGLDYSQFFKGPTQVGFDNVMGHNEAARLNAILSELGDPGQRYAVKASNQISMPNYDDLLAYAMSQKPAPAPPSQPWVTKETGYSNHHQILDDIHNETKAAAYAVNHPKAHGKGVLTKKLNKKLGVG